MIIAMRPPAVALLASLLASELARSLAQCDDPGGACSPITSVNFANSESVFVEAYPTPASTVVGGETYDAVYRWVPESGHALTHSFNVYSTGGNDVSCAGSRVWNHGLSVPFVGEDRAGVQVCTADLSGVFPREDLVTPDVYLLFKGLLPVGDGFFVDRSYENQVAPAPDAIFYLYDFVGTTFALVSAGVEFTVEVEDIVYSTPDFTGPGACSDKPTLLATATFGTCALALASSTATTFTYVLSAQDYEACANTVTGDDQVITYDLDVSLPETVGECHYFRPGDSLQHINVNMDLEDITGDGSVDAQDISAIVTGYDLERCDPLLYVLPQSRAIFTVQMTFGADSLVFDGGYLDTAGNVLTQEGAASCAAHASGNGNVCTLALKSTECRPQFVTDDGACVVERFSENVLQGLQVTVTTDSVDVAATLRPIRSALGAYQFPVEQCAAPENLQLVDVTDSFEGVVDFQNQPGADWSVAAPPVRLFEDIVVRLSLAGAAMAATELQISSVIVSVEDPEDPGVTVASKIFNKGDKVALHAIEQSGYYDDVHFCSWHDSAGNTCPVFYDESSSRVNPFYYSDLQAGYAGLCQTGVDSASTDFFTFTPENWFVSLNMPSVAVNIDVVGTVVYCDARARRLRALQEEEEEEAPTDENVTVSFVRFEEVRAVRTVYYVETPTNDTGTVRLYEHGVFTGLGMFLLVLLDLMVLVCCCLGVWKCCFPHAGRGRYSEVEK